MATKYVFRDNVRVFDNGVDELRLRMGVFNYEEVELDLSTLSQPLSAFMRKVISLLQSEEGLDINLINEQLLEPFEKEIAQSMIEELQATSYIATEEDLSISKDLTLSLLGYLEQDEEMESDEVVKRKKILFFADDDYAADYAGKLSEDMEMPITIMDKEWMQQVRGADLTTNFDGLAGVKTLRLLGEKFKPYDVIVGCMRNLSVVMMRNINRISMELEIPVVLSFIDGPVICVLATNPYTTGCLECFELRTLARLEDHVQYHNFVNRDKPTGEGRPSQGAKPILNMLVNQVLLEAFLVRKIGVSKFTGRLLTVYLPTMEIQAQDILRVPFCPACGAVAKANLEEKNISSRVMVDEMVANALSRK